MTSKFSNKLLSDLEDRGFLYQFTNKKAIDDLFNLPSPVTFYIGFDATAKGLHVGHLLWITLVNKLQNAGHKPIVLVGGATSKIGDPTWKDKQRSMLEYSDILENIESIMRKLKTFIKFGDNKNDAKLVNNDDWFSKISYLDFLRDYGRFFSVNRMLSMDSVSERLKRQQHLSFLEFNYMLLQAYDFLHLYNTYGCMLEIGGADQWSNIISGVDLVRRVKEVDTYGMTINLLTTSSGEKMGKTGSGTVWIDENMTSPFDFWQYWRNVDDKDVCKLLRLFTDLSLNDIEMYEGMIGTAGINDAKIILADNITSFVHSSNSLVSIKETVKSLFDTNSVSLNLENIAEYKIQKGKTLDKAVFESGLADSMTQARKLIENKGVKIDGETITSIKYTLENECIICAGKKNFVRICVE